MVVASVPWVIRAPAAHRRVRLQWHRLYYLLAAFDLFTVADDSFGPDTAHRSAIFLSNDDILSNVDKPACKIARVGRLKSRIGETLTSTVCRDEVLQDVQTFAEVCKDRIFDDFTRGFCH